MEIEINIMTQAYILKLSFKVYFTIVRQYQLWKMKCSDDGFEERLKDYKIRCTDDRVDKRFEI